MLRRFQEEFLVDGALYHSLECGHVHPAQNEGVAALPVDEQECDRCERDVRGRLPN